LKKWEQKNYSEIKNFFLNNSQINYKIKNILGKDYILIDYCYLIENSAIHTYHRDYTSSMKYNNLTFPSYTMILYLDNSDTGLNVIPGSHNDNVSIYLIDRSEKLNFDAGTAILFDADILHAGTASDGNNVERHCIQFKIIHKDDLNKMPWLDNFHVLINRPNNKSLIMKNIEANLTKHLPIFMDNTQDIIKSAFSEEKTSIQKFISSLVFSNEDFYKPIRI
jgi:ectoine hydroxylase-related dioxygenase (phytanoyl-CoA dioxygenase family)